MAKELLLKASEEEFRNKEGDLIRYIKYIVEIELNETIVPIRLKVADKGDMPRALLAGAFGLDYEKAGD